MKVLLVSPEDITGKRWGGVSSYSMLLARKLSSNGHNVSYLSPGKSNRKFIKDGVQIFQIDCYKNLLTKRLFRLVLKVANKIVPLFFWRLIWAYSVYKFVKDDKNYDVVESPEWGNGGLFVSLFLKTKTVVRLHRGWWAYKTCNLLPMTFDDWLVHCLEMLSIILASGITSPTKYMLRLYKVVCNVVGLLQKPITVIPNGIDLSHPSNKKLNMYGKYILILGRLENAKGQLILLKAFKKIIKKNIAIQLLIVGEDTSCPPSLGYNYYSDYLNSYITKNNLNKFVKILGKKEKSELSKLYRNALLVIVPSIGNENQPMVILEAMAFNKPIIASNAGGIPEIIHDHKNGILFESEDHRDLAKKIGLLISDRNLRTRISSSGSSYLSKYDIDLTVKSTVRIYRSL